MIDIKFTVYPHVLHSGMPQVSSSLPVHTAEIFFDLWSFFFLPPLPLSSPPPRKSLCFWSAVRLPKESRRLRMLLLNRSLRDCQLRPSTTFLNSINCHNDTPPVSADRPLSRMKLRIFCENKNIEFRLMALKLLPDHLLWRNSWPWPWTLGHWVSCPRSHCDWYTQSMSPPWVSRTYIGEQRCWCTQLALVQICSVQICCR